MAGNNMYKIIGLIKKVFSEKCNILTWLVIRILIKKSKDKASVKLLTTIKI